ncbi:hypothetical protein Hanom_Chr12g01116821 [Helianthus anomalus]
MQTSYDQLLADHHCLISGTFVIHSLLFSCFYSLVDLLFFLSDKSELERDRDRAVQL